MKTILTSAVQDYLKIIYDLRASGREASTMQLAGRLGVAPASVTGMLQRLAGIKPPLVLYQKHQGASLTARGEKAALEVIRHHRLLEEYLVKTLGYTWDSVHDEADKLEHAISEDFEARIDDLLDHPVRDPHGELIPSRDLVLPIDESISLSELRPPQSAVVRRVNGSNGDLLRYLDGIGVVPGARIALLGFSPLDRVVRLRVEGNTGGEVAVGPAITGQVFVEIIP
jgi:DtxR family Mn-dependent transcriptional regulator